MARVCKVTGKRLISGSNVSRASNKTRRRLSSNLQSRRLWVENEDHWARLRVPNTTLYIINKVSVDVILADLHAHGKT